MQEDDELPALVSASLDEEPADLMFDPVPMLTVKEVCELFNIARSTLYARLENDPSFPRPRKFGSAVRWLESEIEEYQNQLPVAEYGQPDKQ